MEQKLNGSKFIKRTIRPPRIAFVIKTLDNVKKFISIASLSWGGRHFIAIPCNEDGWISEEWLDVIKKYNPDSIKTFHQLPQEVEEKLWKSKFAINKITNHTEIKIDHLYDQTKTKHIPEFFGQPIINFFLLDDFYDLDKDKAHLSYIPTESNFDLYYWARFGVIDNNEWLRWQDIYINHQHRKSHPDELIENAPLVAEQDILSYIHQNRYKDNEYTSLLDYTINRLGQVHISRVTIDEQPKSETTHIVVVSKDDNVEDFCWFWAIRGQRYNPFDFYSKGPIWINLKSFKLDLLQQLFINRKNIYVVSKSLSEKDLPSITEGWFFQNEDLNEFYNSHYYIGDTTDVPLNFVDNTSEYKFEAPESIRFLNSSRIKDQYAIFDFQIPELTLPRVRDFSFEKFTFINYLVTKSGLSHIIFSNNDELIKLSIPTSWDVISTFANAVDYHIELSDKGRIGNELVKLIGGEKYVWLLSHPAILDLLLEMSNVNKINDVRKLVRDSVKDDEAKNRIINSLPRKSLTRNNLFYSAIKTKLKTEINGEKLDDKSSMTIIEWLLNIDILRQGKTIKCNSCFTENWVSINSFNSKIICNGCANEIKKPFGIDKIDWEYEINTLVSSEIDQGLLIHLLTGCYIIDDANSTFHKKNIYGAYYGINFIKHNRSNETDIVFTVDGQLIIGECKISGKEFTQNIIQENINFAKEINASKLIFSCLEHVEELQNNLKNNSFSGLEIIVLGKDDLLFQFPGLAFEKQHTDKLENRKPINRHESYKRSLESLKDNYEYEI